MGVIDLDQSRREREQREREATTPHLEGRAICLACRHSWHAVAPVGTVWLECPSCTMLRGCFRGPAVVNEPHWHCACNNDLFHITRQGVYCPNCGLWQKNF